MGFVHGDPGAIMIVEYAGETDAEVRAKVEALDARRQRERFGYTAHVAHDAAEQALDLEAAEGRARAPARDEGRQEADRVRRGHRGRTRSTWPSS